MNATPENVNRPYSQELEEFERQLGPQEGPDTPLIELANMVKRLLIASPDGESDVRALLHRRLDAGEIRQDTFDIVLKILESAAGEIRESGTARLIPTDGPAKSTDTLVIDADDAASFPLEITEPPATEEPQPDSEAGRTGTLLRDRYKLHKQVADSGLGVLFKAGDREVEAAGGLVPWIAVKVIDPVVASSAETIRVLHQEGAKARCLTHANIARLIDVQHHDDGCCVVSEWLDGRSLAAILADGKGGRIDREMAFDIVRQIGEALDYAHRCGVMHGDIKPSNVMILPSGQIKLTDFGAARVRQEIAKNQRGLTQAINAETTASYASMQVLTGEMPVPADDVFSLGCLMYRLIAGYRVFGPKNAAAAAEEGMAPQQPKHLEAGDWKALKRSLAFARVSRFSTVREFLDALTPPPAASNPVPPQPQFVAPEAEAEPVPVPAPEPETLPEAQTVRQDVREIRVTAEDTLSNRYDMDNRKPWGIILAAVAAVAVVVAFTEPGFVDQLRGFIDWPDETATSPVETASADTTAAPPKPAETAAQQPQTSQPAAVETPGGSGGSTQVAETVADSKPRETVADSSAPPAEYQPEDVATANSPASEATLAEQAEVAAELPPQPALPPATLVIPLERGWDSPDEYELTLAENGRPAIIELVRREGLGSPLSLEILEISYSGNHSPLKAGQYLIENGGVVSFAAGQERARTTISMAQDPLREPDRTVTLSFADVRSAGPALAALRLRLEDDDQRAFEARLPPNTVAFAVSRVSVQEGDDTAQVDLLRFNPSNVALSVGYVIRGVTAKEGEDYLQPRSTTVNFGPGQRSARILVPLVQDDVYEGDEAIMLELIVDQSSAETDLFRRIAVMIRDDEAPGR